MAERPGAESTKAELEAVGRGVSTEPLNAEVPRDPNAGRTPESVPDAESTGPSPRQPVGSPEEQDDGGTQEGVAKEQRRKPKPAPIRSLVDLYSVKGANASRLLRELEKSTSWKFADEDMAAALALIPDRDPYLARTRQLVHESIETHDGRFARTACDFALAAMDHDLAGLPSWPPSDDTDPLDPLSELSHRLSRDLRNAKRRRRALNTLMICLDVLSYRRGLAFENAAPVLREAVGRPPEYERSRSNPRRHRVASVTLPKNDLERVRDLLDLLQPWEQELQDIRGAERKASSDAEIARKAADDATRQLAEVEATVSNLRSELEQVRQDAKVSRDSIQDVRIHASADVTELRARMLAFLNTRLRDLVTTAKEASEVEPPRAATAVRLLEQAIQELREEVEWLRSSA